jgi:hypothetical protein
MCNTIITNNLKWLVLLVFYPAFCSVVSVQRHAEIRCKPSYVEKASFRSKTLSHTIVPRENRPSIHDIQLCQRLSRCGSWSEVLEILDPFVKNRTADGLSNLSAVCLSTAFHRIAKGVSPACLRTLSGHPTYDALISSINMLVTHGAKRGLECRHVANIAWAAARLELCGRADGAGEKLFLALAHESTRRLRAFRCALRAIAPRKLLFARPRPSERATSVKRERRGRRAGAARGAARRSCPTSRGPGPPPPLPAPPPPSPLSRPSSCAAPPQRTAPSASPRPPDDRLRPGTARKRSSRRRSGRRVWLTARADACGRAV